MGVFYGAFAVDFLGMDLKRFHLYEEEVRQRVYLSFIFLAADFLIHPLARYLRF